METEYNWELILKVAAPLSLAEAYIFYTNISDGWKWFSLVVGIILSGVIMYFQDKKKSNVFTAVALVFLAALVVRLLKNFGAL